MFNNIIRANNFDGTTASLLSVPTYRNGFELWFRNFTFKFVPTSIGLQSNPH